MNPDTGTIAIDGTDISKEPLEAKRKIGYVPDEPVLYERLTGLEYLNFMADVYQVPASERKERIEYFLEMFNLRDAAADMIKSYSHGMRQKTALAGALLHDPKLWILDEPMVGLDPKSAHLLKNQMRGGTVTKAIPYFSRRMSRKWRRKLCDRVAIINRGKLIAIGTVDELRHGDQKDSLEKIFLELTEQ